MIWAGNLSPVVECKRCGWIVSLWPVFLLYFRVLCWSRFSCFVACTMVFLLISHSSFSRLSFLCSSVPSPLFSLAFFCSAIQFPSIVVPSTRLAFHSARFYCTLLRLPYLPASLLPYLPARLLTCLLAGTACLLAFLAAVPSHFSLYPQYIPISGIGRSYQGTVGCHREICTVRCHGEVFFFKTFLGKFC